MLSFFHTDSILDPINPFINELVLKFRIFMVLTKNRYCI